MHVSYESYNIQLAEIIATAKAAKFSPCEPPKRIRFFEINMLCLELLDYYNVDDHRGKDGDNTINRNNVQSNPKQQFSTYRYTWNEDQGPSQIQIKKQK